MAGSIVLGMVFTVVGLWLSYAWNLTSRASIILVSGAAYLASLVIRSIWMRRA
jgi:zinc transport system permease protein